MAEAKIGQSKDAMISKVKEIISNEKFKLDAYYFCGCPSGTPNQKLLETCQAYVKAVESGLPHQEAAQSMIVELENALANKSEAADNLVNNDADLREVLEHRELLLEA